jgi:hypothetical protein
MRKTPKIIATAAIIILMQSCVRKDDNPVSAPVPDETNGRITVVNDETKLNARVTTRNELIKLDTTRGLGRTHGSNAFSMTLVAEIAPPTVNGQTLMATSVSLDGQFAYISYNLRGESYGGGVDIVQLKGTQNATIRSEALFSDTKVSSVFYDNTTSRLYLAEASNNPAFAYPATVEMLKISGNKLNLSGAVRTVLTSYVATSITSVGGLVFATTGNTGGLYTLTPDSLKVVTYVALSDARWVDFDPTSLTLATVQGGGKLYVFSPLAGAFGNTYSFAGTGIPESKSTVEVIGGKALIAAGDGGVKLVNIANGTVVGSIARAIVPGMDPSLSVTNAATGAKQYVYISNGEAGIYVAQASQLLENNSGNTPIGLTVLGKLQFATNQSANHVAFDGSTLVIASGLGGVKIVSVNF